MEKLSNEERAARKELARSYSSEQTKKRELGVKALPEPVRKYLEYSSRYDGGMASKLNGELTAGLESGKYKKPSEFILKNMPEIFGEVVPESMKDSLLWSVDNCISWLYSCGYTRRSFRSSTYLHYLDKIHTIVYAYAINGGVKKPFEQLVKGDMTEAERACFDEYPNQRNEFDICYCIEQGCPTTIQYISELLEGASAEGLTYDIFRAIFMSKSAELHQLAGKLLLAARLQEGLRQAICETCDSGSIAAFRYMLGMITENDLIRYSSVKRAIGTWTGLVAADSGDLDRISTKTLALINGCLSDEGFREECLGSDDAMKVYIGLWAIGVEDVIRCSERMVSLARTGSHQQVLAAAYFMGELWTGPIIGNLAMELLLTRNTDHDIMSFAISNLFRGITVSSSKNFDAEARFSASFKDRAEGELCYSKLMEIYEAIPKKELTFSPCVFPWYTATLTKSNVVQELIYVAAILDDNDKKDVMCKKIPEIDVSGYGTRRFEIELLLSEPETDAHLDMLVSELADREEYSRGAAYMAMLNNIGKLTDRHYLMLEDMLRYKSSDIRAHVVDIMLKRTEGLYESIERLLTDKKEEKRTAGLDMIMQLGKDEARSELYARCLTLVPLIEKPSTKEQILIDSLTAASGGSGSSEEGFGLYSENDSFEPMTDFGEYGEECLKTFLKYFPHSTAAGGKASKSEGDFEKPLKALDELIEEHKNDEFTSSWGEKALLGQEGFLREKAPDGSNRVPFGELWDKFYDEHIKDPVLLFRMQMGIYGGDKHEFSSELFGKEFDRPFKFMHRNQIESVIEAHLNKHFDKDELGRVGFAAVRLICEAAESGRDMFAEVPHNSTYWHPTYTYVKNGKVVQTDQSRIISIFDDMLVKQVKFRFNYNDKQHLAESFSLGYRTSRCFGKQVINEFLKDKDSKNTNSIVTYDGPGETVYMRAAYSGVISEGFMYRTFLNDAKLDGILGTVCGIAQSFTDSERKRMTRQRWGGWRTARALSYLLNETEPVITDENRPLVEYVFHIYEKLTAPVLDSELRRGDSPARFTDAATGITRIYGCGRFVQILSALGRDTLERSYYYSGTMSKRQSLSRLLGVCVPGAEDTAEQLGKLLKKTDITEKRLVEAALYSPEWIDLVGEHLGWEGFRPACFYFMAHMNERFDDVRKAMIAKFTPIPTEELAGGAFDINWFRDCYGAVGAKRFDTIYDAAKYITDGARHSRARKYADAVLGRLDRADAEKQIKDKRNKDTLMALALIPIKDEDDILSRYILFKQFAKESRQFGAQRRASETAASDMAIRNLAENAGCSDVTRLSLRMETKLFDDIRPLTEPNAVGDITVKLEVTESGTAELVCEKNGKALRSIPAKLKKDELILRMGEVKKQLTEQYRRTRIMLEQAMEDRTGFLASELAGLQQNPVIWPLIRDTVFVCGKDAGFFADMKLTPAKGKAVSLKSDSVLIAAHPFDLWSAGSWRDYQQVLFEQKRVQPFRQVFRELYVKSEDERGAMTSTRYAGNQINPKQTIGCLKGRRWVADVEDGLQKVYYKENIIARIYALADWFSPADIEAPTLEWVDFFDRKDGHQLPIDDIPDIIFSEVMRDVDLAVSVAHAGGVDPETSHSTVEMRRAICEFTMPLFKLTNVTFEKSHAFIKGSLADYSVHLGSGVVHLQGGPMINVLPVHSQHRGRLFLPFIDEDPKTAEIISKILLFAEDDKIKDPFILDQIR